MPVLPIIGEVSTLSLVSTAIIVVSIIVIAWSSMGVQCYNAHPTYKADYSVQHTLLGLGVAAGVLGLLSGGSILAYNLTK